PQLLCNILRARWTLEFLHSLDPNQTQTASVIYRSNWGCGRRRVAVARRVFIGECISYDLFLVPRASENLQSLGQAHPRKYGARKALATARNCLQTSIRFLAQWGHH